MHSAYAFVDGNGMVACTRASRRIALAVREAPRDPRTKIYSRG